MIDVVPEWGDMALVKVIQQYHNPTTTFFFFLRNTTTYMDTRLKIFECLCSVSTFSFLNVCFIRPCMCLSLVGECSSSF